MLEELKKEQAAYEQIQKKHYSEITEDEAQREKEITKKMWKMIHRHTPRQSLILEDDIVQDGIEYIFMDDCHTRLEALRHALQYRNSNEMAVEISENIENEYICQKWSQKSVQVYENCLQRYLDEGYGPLDTFDNLAEIAGYGALLMVKQAAAETIEKLAEYAEEIKIEE